MNRRMLVVSGLFFILMLGLLSLLEPKAELDDAFADLQADPSSMDKWRARIVSAAQRLRIEPINARVDRVWKAIPGYNGLEVDIDRTLKLVMEHPSSLEIPFVYREIEPSITLADLPAEPIYKGNPNKPMVAFMVNVAWGNEYLPELLAVLKEEKVKTTFFLDGSWLKNNKEWALKLLEEGHELANHGYSHKNMSKLSDAAANEEIRKTEVLLQQLGVNNKLFAPPSGDFDAQTVKLAKKQGLYTILWTLDTVDWRKPDPASVISKINAQLEPGALILMHPTEASSKALGSMLQHAKREGYAIGKVSELIDEKRITAVESKVDF